MSAMMSLITQFLKTFMVGKIMILHCNVYYIIKWIDIWELCIAKRIFLTSNKWCSKPCTNKRPIQSASSVNINRIEYEKFTDMFWHFRAESFQMPPHPFLVLKELNWWESHALPALAPGKVQLHRPCPSSQIVCPSPTPKP